MRDLTTGSALMHVIRMAGPTFISLIVQLLCGLVDLYFISGIGEHALAGLAAAQNVILLVLAASQILSVGATSLISRAIGRSDTGFAQTTFDQSLSLATCAAIATIVASSAASMLFSLLTADADTARMATRYFYATLPSTILLFPSAAVGGTLRGTGVVFAPMLIQLSVVGVNILLAPLLIAGWGTGHAFGVVGAGLATSTANMIGAVAFLIFLNSPRIPFQLRPRSWKPRSDIWKEILKVGGPSSLDFLLVVALSMIMYWRLRVFGTATQAGYALGSQLQQFLLLPAAALAYSAAPVLGQNLSAGRARRVIHTFRDTMLITFVLTTVSAILSYTNPTIIIAHFRSVEPVSAAAADFLRLTSWNIVGFGLTLVATSMFQAAGNTRPPLLSSASRLFTFAIPLIWLVPSCIHTFESVLRLSALSVGIEATACLLFLYLEMPRIFSNHRAASGTANHV